MKHGKLNLQGNVQSAESKLSLDFATQVLMRNLIQESFDRKAHDLSGDENLGNIFIDVYSDNTGIDSGNSSGYTYRGSANYDVIVAAGLDLDMMEYASDGAAQAAYVTSAGAGEPPSWDLLDEDCSGIGDWTDDDKGVGVSEVDPAGQFRFDTNAGAASNDYASRYRDIGSCPNTFTVEIKLYHDTLGVHGSDYFGVAYSQADESLEMSFNTGGLFIYDNDAGNTEVGTDLVKYGGSAEWQTWRILVTFTGTTGDGTCDVYLDDSTHNWEKVGTAIPCSYEYSYATNRFRIRNFGNNIDDMVTHVDYIKIYDGLITPVSALQSYSEASIKNQGSYSLKAIAAITDSLNDTLTKSGLSIDLTDRDELKLDVRASRTGTNLQLQLKQPAGYTADLIPDMTSNTAPSGVASADGETYAAWKAMNDSNAGEGDCWYSVSTLPHWLKYQFTSGKTIVRYTITSRDYSTIEYPIDFTLQGSNNDSDWDILDTQTGQSFTQAEKKTYSFSNSTSYTYYKLNVTDSSHGGDGKVAIGELELMEEAWTTHTKDIIISSADVFQEITWDISGIANANKDDITKIIFKIINADSATTYYIDNFRVPSDSAIVICNIQTLPGSTDEILVMWEENVPSGDTITIYVSADNGANYTEVTSPSSYSSPIGTAKYKLMTGLTAGTQGRLKAVITGSAQLESIAMAW